MKRVAFIMLIFGLSALFSANAHAESCSVSMTPINFGSFSPIRGTSGQVTGTATVTCTWSATTSTPYAELCLYLSDSGSRALTNGANQLAYDLYIDSSYTVRWEPFVRYLSTTTELVKPTGGTSGTFVVTFYGKIPGNQATVPTAGNSSTQYSQHFTAGMTELDYRFASTPAPKNADPDCITGVGGNARFPFTVTATVVNDCLISTTNIVFPDTGSLSAALAAPGSIRAQCTNGDAYRIDLSAGSSGDVAARQMQRAGGGGTIAYQLYTDAGHTSAWGDGTGGTVRATATGTGNEQAFTVYGVVPAQASPAPGSYSDRITATISF